MSLGPVLRVYSLGIPCPSLCFLCVDGNVINQLVVLPPYLPACIHAFSAMTNSTPLET